MHEWSKGRAKIKFMTQIKRECFLEKILGFLFLYVFCPLCIGGRTFNALSSEREKEGGIQVAIKKLIWINFSLTLPICRGICIPVNSRHVKRNTNKEKWILSSGVMCVSMTQKEGGSHIREVGRNAFEVFHRYEFHSIRSAHAQLLLFLCIAAAI